jgi:hypothetical protein
MSISSPLRVRALKKMWLAFDQVGWTLQWKRGLLVVSMVV